jgi:NosR/NirI family transcriptional regulator, nitrous oxide reductase regulator
MKRILAAFRTVLAATALALVAPLVQATAYEAPLPAQISTDPDLCAMVACGEVMPGADSFSERMGRPAYVEAYRSVEGQKKRIGYVFLSTDIVDIPAYSGKPVITLIGMDNEGIIVGTRILRHSEPILLLGIPEEVLTRFVNQYLGKFVGDKIEIGKSRPDAGYIGLDAITGATVTVIAQNQVMLRSGVAIARQVGIIQSEPKPQARFTDIDEPRSWDELVREGSVQRLTVRPEQLGLPRTPEPYIEMHFGYLNAPAIGKSLLGVNGYERLMSRLEAGEHAIFIIANGVDSFKGSGFVRGGIYDRIQVAQDMDTFTFRDMDYYNLWGLEAAGAPAYQESGIFIIRDPVFSAAYPWSLVYLGNKLDRNTGERSFVSFDREYWLSPIYLEGGRPRIVKPDPPWVRVWKMRAVEIGLFAAFLVAVATVYANRNRLTRMSTRKNKWPVNAFKYGFWVISVGFVGFYLLAQPSITQVLTWFHALLFQWKWELFLTDPFIFLFWIFIIVTVFVWGRGLFCGWMCPFGSLSELMYKIGGAIGLKRFQFKLSKPWHDRLKWVKYVVFFVLLAVSMFSMGLAEILSEVEPFKTTFLVGLFSRTWPYTLFAAGLLALSIFIERPFCKYLCPLGAALAVPSTFRWYGLKRKQECDSCKACAVGCGSLAIDKDGRIDQRECLLCLDCMVFYTDEHACPPLAKERKRRLKAGLPLTPIGADGYYIPIHPEPMRAAPAGKS